MCEMVAPFKYGIQDVRNILPNGFWSNAVGLIISSLACPSPICFIKRILHRVCDTVAVKNDPPIEVSCRTANGLDKRCFGPQIALLIGIQNSDERTFWNVQTSRSRLMPISTSNTPSLRSRIISIRSSVSISECR